jgi:hypothetical protein
MPAQTTGRSRDYALEKGTRAVLMSLIAGRKQGRILVTEPLVPNSSVLFIDDAFHAAEPVVTALSAELHADCLTVDMNDIDPLVRTVDERGSATSRGRPLLALVSTDAPEITRETVEAIGGLVQRFHQDDNLGILFVSAGRIMPDAEFAGRFDLVLSLRPHARPGSLDQLR